MPAEGQQSNSQPQNSAPATYEELVRQIAQRVWELWQRDLRREHERRGKAGK